MRVRQQEDQMKGKDCLTNAELANLTQKEQKYEEDPDTVEGLGHAKRHHINSGIYTGIENP